MKTKVKKKKVRSCRFCGCTDRKGCLVDAQGRTCCWVGRRTCSKCAFERQELQRLERRVAALESHPMLRG